MNKYAVAGAVLGMAAVSMLAWGAVATNHQVPHRVQEVARLRTAPIAGMQRSVQGEPDAAMSLRSALQQRHAMLHAGSLSVAAPTWTELGPSNVGGRVNAILTNPANSSQLFIGTAGGGIWQSSNGGNSWSSVGDFLGSLAVSALARVPAGSVPCATSDILMAGTGDQFNTPRRGLGILVSSDGGSTWNVLSSTDPTSNQDWFYVNSIAVNPSGVILVGTGIAPTSRNWGDVYRSTDCGASFTQVATGVSLDVAFDPNNGNNAVAEFEDGTIRYSTDAGSTWSLAVTVAPGGGRLTLAYAAPSGWIYAAVDDSPTGPASGSVYQSIDGGGSWHLQGAPSGGLFCSGGSCQGGYDNVLWVDPFNAGVLVAGGINLFSSSNGGLTWTQISDWTNTPTSPHADHHALAASAGFNGSTNLEFFDGDDGGFYETSDILTAGTTSGWTEANTGLADTQFYSVAGYAGDQTTRNGKIMPVVGGSQDNGTLLYDMNSNNPASWTTIFGGDGGMVDVDPLDADYIYGEYIYLDLFQSSKGGLNATNFTSLPADANNPSGALFIAPFLLDPTADDGMFAGGASLWYGSGVKTLGPTWHSLNGTSLPSNSIVAAIAVNPTNDNEVWAGLYSGLYHSSNALSPTPAWTQLGAGVLPTASESINSIYLDPSDSNRVYIAFFSRTGQSLWESKDGGASWADISAGLPQVPVNDVTTDGRSHLLIAATELGLFESADDGTTWGTDADGPANVAISKLKWFDACAGKLLAATYGRGMFLGAVPNAGSVSAPVPSATVLSPSSAAANGAASSLVVTGSGFSACSSVEWNGVALATRYVSAGELVATLSTTDLATVGDVSVTVSSPAPGGGASSALTFTVVNPVPVLSALNPASANAGAAALTLNVSGDKFEPTSQVTWNGATLSTTYVSATALVANVPAADLSATGSATVAVSTPTPGGGTSGPATFTIDSPPSGGKGGGALGWLSLLMLIGAAVAKKLRR